MSSCTKISYERSMNQTLFILIVFSVFLANVLFHGYIGNLPSISDQKVKSPVISPDGSSQTIIDKQVNEQVENALTGFIGGFLGQGSTGDPTVFYFIQNPTISIGFGVSSVKILLKDTTDSNNPSFTEVSETFTNSNLVKPTAMNPRVSQATYFISSSIGTTRFEYQTIVYKNLYNNIDLEFEIQNRNLKYNFYVNPGGNPKNIQMQWNGPISIGNINNEMKISISTTFGEKVLIDEEPIALQAGLQLSSISFDYISSSSYGFTITNYNPKELLIIDPTILLYSSFFGGSKDDEAYGIAVDNNGNVYVTGETFSSDFPIFNAYDSSFNSGSYSDIFVFKLSATGNSLLYSTFIGGSKGEIAYAIAVDSSGNAYVTGFTGSTDFPTFNAYDSSQNGGTDVIVFKLTALGNSLFYSTYVGGSGLDSAYSIAIDSSGNAYVTGSVISTNFPMVNAYDSVYNGGDEDVFVFKLSSLGNSLLYSTYVGGSLTEIGYDIAVDTYGYAYVTGVSDSTNFPTINFYQNTLKGNYDVFVFKLSTTGKSLQFSTYVGGSSSDGAQSIAIDSNGNVYVTGNTISSDFPTTADAYDSSWHGYSDVFVFKLSATGTSLLYSTFVGGSNGDEVGYGIVVDGNGLIYVTGLTSSSNFPTTYNAYDSSFNGNDDVFVFKLSTSLGLLYSTYLGGTNIDWAENIVVDGNGNVYVVGWTTSSDFTTVNAYDYSYNGVCDVFVFKLITFPDIKITIPLNGSLVNGLVSIEANVNDLNGLSYVEEKIDSGAWNAGCTLLGCDKQLGAFTWKWDSTTVADGKHTIWVQTQDTLGNYNIANITVIVDNTGPDISFNLPLSNAIVSGTITIVTSASDLNGISNVNAIIDNICLFTSNSTSNSWLFDTKTVTDGIHTIQVQSYDTLGNLNTVSVIITVDNTGPSLSISSPVNGSTVSGTMTILALSSDSNGVSCVEYNIDNGIWIIDNSSPYSWSFDTTTINNGYHIINFKAFDVAGNFKITAININVKNIATTTPSTTTPPTTTTPETTCCLPPVNNSKNISTTNVDLFAVMISLGIIVVYSKRRFS